MATITFVNNVLPKGGLNFNPEIEEALDPTFTLGAANAGLYEIINNSGPLEGFKVQLTSHVNGTGNFSYLIDAGTGEAKPTGTITGMTLRAPDGSIVAEVTLGSAGFGDYELLNFYARLVNPAHTPAAAIANALNELISKNSLFLGSSAADHIKVVDNIPIAEVQAGGGNDLITAFDYGQRLLVGGDGNDLFRVDKGIYEIRGANADGTGGAAQIDTVEIVARGADPAYSNFYRSADIDVLRFVAIDPPAPPSPLGSPTLRAEFHLSSTDPFGLPKAVVVESSMAAAPSSWNAIKITVDYNTADTKGTTIDISGWTFKNWDSERGSVEITTNPARALNDIVIGSKVADEIYTTEGDDTLRGGGGADELYGGVGNDTFVYGRNEAADGEVVFGGSGPTDGTADKVLILAENDFTGVVFTGIDQFVFGGAARALFNQTLLDASGTGPQSAVIASPPPTIVGSAGANTVAFQLEKAAGETPSIDLSDVVFKNWSRGSDFVTITGLNVADTISGSAVNDVINGGGGSDDLQGNAGADAFVFDAGFGQGVDHIADFHRKEGDRIHLDNAMFTRLKPGVLKKSAFEIGERADSRKDRVIYDKDDGVIRYDDDGKGKHKAVIIAVLDDAASLKAGDILVI